MSTHPQPGKALRWPGSLGPLLGILSAALAAVIVVLLALDQPGGAVAAAILLLLLGGVGVADSLAARRKLSRHGDRAGAVEADDRDSIPAMPTGEAAPLGATDESHTDLDPHDLPPGHPARRAIEEEDAGSGARRH